MTLFPMPHPDQMYGNRTWAQHGDDLMILNVCTLIGITNPSWLDLGCHDPCNISNTKLFYDLGFRGVNVDANQNHIDAFRKARPEDTNICVGVAADSGIRDFYMYDDYSGLNTFSISETMALKGKMEITSVIRVPVVTMNQIVDKHCNGQFPPILSVDIEGLDREVLKYANFSKSRPIIIVVETRHNTKDTEDMLAVLIEKDYSPVCRMGGNILFLQNSYCESYLFGKV